MSIQIRQFGPTSSSQDSVRRKLSLHLGGRRIQPAFELAASLPRQLSLAVLALAASRYAVAHDGIVAAHSPPNGAPGQCATDHPLQLFVLPEPRVGGPLLPGETAPAIPAAAAAVLARVSPSALLARPELGGFVYSASSPGLDLIDAANPCHAVTLQFTAGTPFVIRLDRRYWPDDGQNLMMADPFGALVLLEDGQSYTYANQSQAHVHPLWLARRPGRFHIGLGFSSDYFFESEPFSTSFVTATECFEPVPLDLSPAFNADVVDSDAGDNPTSFDGAGRSWLLNGHLGTQSGLPLNGELDLFQLGGPAGARLSGAAANCLFDNGVLSSAATIDLAAQSRNGPYESLELLIGAAGAFTSADQLVVRMTYATGNPQVVTIRRAAANPKFFPLNDWRITTSPLPHLAVGRAGDRTGGGFVRSTGSAVDIAAGSTNYFQRVTFPVDRARELRSISFDDYIGANRVGVFAITGIAAQTCPNGDFDQNQFVDAADFASLPACWTAPDVQVGSAPCNAFDIAQDDDIDLRDFAEFQRRFGQPTP